MHVAALRDFVLSFYHMPLANWVVGYPCGEGAGRAAQIRVGQWVTSLVGEGAGGAARARKELRALVGSYDACQLSAGVLEALAQAGFADVAAAVAAR